MTGNNFRDYCRKILAETYSNLGYEAEARSVMAGEQDKSLAFLAVAKAVIMTATKSDDNDAKSRGVSNVSSVATR